MDDQEDRDDKSCRVDRDDDRDNEFWRDDRDDRDDNRDDWVDEFCPQMIRVIDRLWLRRGLDLSMVSFKVIELKVPSFEDLLTSPPSVCSNGVEIWGG